MAKFMWNQLDGQLLFVVAKYLNMLVLTRLNLSP